MKTFILIIVTLLSVNGIAQQESGAQQFWSNLKSYCGNAYEGTVIEAPENDDFRGKKLVIHIKKCSENSIRIPFSVGENKSRTFVLSMQNERIQLKHDHRHEDGTSDKVTMYGGTTPNSGSANIQFFPADQETANLIPYAATNVWWIVIEDNSFTYNLRRIGTDRLFSIKFDLTKPVEIPSAHWGSID
jgi:hypothetical protein